MRTVIVFSSRAPEGMEDARAWATQKGMKFLFVKEIEELRERLNDLGHQAWVIITDHGTVMNLWDPTRSNGVLMVIGELKKIATSTPRLVLGVSAIESNRRYLSSNGCDETADESLVTVMLDKLQQRLGS